MKELEKVFKDKFVEYSNEYEYKNLKEKRGKFYKVIIDTINEVLKKSLNNSNLMLINHSFTKLRLTLNKPKTLVFCGCYFLNGEKVLYFQDKKGSYIFDNENISRQLTSCRIGTLIELKKNEFSIDLRVPSQDIGIGLFEKK